MRASTYDAETTDLRHGLSLLVSCRQCVPTSVRTSMLILRIWTFWKAHAASFNPTFRAFSLRLQEKRRLCIRVLRVSRSNFHPITWATSPRSHRARRSCGAGRVLDAYQPY